MGPLLHFIWKFCDLDAWTNSRIGFKFFLSPSWLWLYCTTLTLLLYYSIVPDSRLLDTWLVSPTNLTKSCEFKSTFPRSFLDPNHTVNVSMLCVVPSCAIDNTDWHLHWRYLFSSVPTPPTNNRLGCMSWEQRSEESLGVYEYYMFNSMSLDQWQKKGTSKLTLHIVTLNVGFVLMWTRLLRLLYVGLKLRVHR